MPIKLPTISIHKYLIKSRNGDNNEVKDTILIAASQESRRVQKCFLRFPKKP